jgi:hypothetical protein
VRDRRDSGGHPRVRDRPLKTQMTTFTTLINFDGTNGKTPDAGLIADAAGDLFGTTASGLSNDGGTRL